MRPDMSKVLVERPRGGGGKTRGRGRPPRDPDLLRAKLTGNRIAVEAGASKWSSENLAPLKRYIERQEGRPWNKVFSEMREHIKPGNTVQEHILTHLEGYLATNVEKVEPSRTAPCGLVYGAGHRWGAGRPLDEHDHYVDPDDGIIKRAKRRLKGPRFTAAAPGALRHLGGIRWAIPVRGVWMSVVLAPYVLRYDLNGRASAFVVDRSDRAVWTDPLEGTLRPWDKGRLAKLETRYGPSMLAHAMQPVSPGQRKLHRLRDVPSA